MKTILVLFLVMYSLSLYASMGSLVMVPTSEHMKYAFGNHKNHPAQKQEEVRYLKSLAPMDSGAIQKHFTQQGYNVMHIKLRDIASELVYEIYAIDATKKSVRLYADPKNGSVLKMENIQ